MTKYILLTLIIIINSNTLFACMCGPSIQIKERIENSDYVALVTIQDIVSMRTHAYYKTIIKEDILFKGRTSTEIITYGSNRLVDSTFFTNCDIPLAKGDQWVIFGKMKNGKIQIEYCDGSFIYRYSDGYRDIMNGKNIKALNEVNAYFHKPIIDFYKKRGLVRVNYPNGNIEMITRFKNGVKHGLTKFYYPDGKLIMEETYIKGKLNGKRIKYFHEGTINTIEYFKNGVNIDSSNSYEYNIDSGRYYMWNTSFYTKNGQMISNKYYSIPIKHKGMPSFFNGDAFYLKSEWFMDTLKNETTHIDYHPNGRVRTRYMLDAKSNFIGDEISMDSLGRVTKILRSVKGKNNQIIYIDTAAWPNYKKWK
jgi:antitoxin component YwqK of YwqJK toxin-antitoxin module